MYRTKTQFMRLQALDEAIRQKRYPNCLSFASEWEVAQKTILRDIEFIKYVLGAPVDYNRRKQGYYYKHSNWFLPALSVSESELLSLALGAQAATLYQDTPLAKELNKILEKIVDSLPENLSIVLEEVMNNVSFVGHPARTIDSEIWRTFVKAIARHTVLNITYRSEGKPNAKSHLLYPYHIANIQDDWYVFGVIPPHDNIIQFALSRFESVKTTKKSFQFSAQEDVKKRIQEAFGHFIPRGIEPIYDVCIAFDSDISHRITARQWHPKQILKTNEDGSGTLEFTAASLEETMRWVLGWGRHVKVLEPKKLKKLVALEIQNMQN
jgi:predicted DNA-binding transcriptional regulator YafY